MPISRSMCGRFTRKMTWRELHALYSIHDRAKALNLGSHMNICPTDPIVIVREAAFDDGTRGREAASVRWSLVPPSWTELSTRYALHNARAETVHEKPAFRDALKHRRCLIPANGFYEWKTEPGAPGPKGGKGKPKKTRYYITTRSGAPLTFAGLWERNERLAIESATMIVTDANELMAPIHDRMPVILAEQDWEAWLAEPRLDLLKPAPVDELVAYPVKSEIKDEDGEEAVAQLADPKTRPRITVS